VTVRTEAHHPDSPQIIRDGVDAAAVAEQLRAKMRSGRSTAVSLPGR